MGITCIRIRNFKSVKKLDYDISRGKVNCLLGKNGVGKTTIDKAILYFYEIANNPYALKDVIDKRNPYIQKLSIEIEFDFKNLQEQREHNVYIDNDISDFAPFIINQKLAIKFTQYKNGKTEWYPLNDRYKVSKVLKIFPVYMMQTKKIDLVEWNKLWDIVTDIAITGIKEDKRTVRELLKTDFEQIYGMKYGKAFDVIDQVMKKESISVNDEEFKKRFKNALMTNIGGEMFMLEEQNIDFYSDGVNSLKYLSILIRLLSELSSLSWKEIMIILDEPEISLHLQYIEELASVIAESANKVSFIIATHSTRLISSLLRESTNEFKIKFNQVCYVNGYSILTPLQDIASNTDKYLMRDNEAESYFANAILFVEGQTEIQLFKDKNIVRLFPQLRKLTIYNTHSNDNATELIIPKYNNPTVPFLVLLDMDKILSYSKEKNVFYLRNGNTVVNPLANKNVEEREKYYYYGMRKRITYNCRNRIENELSENNTIDINAYYNTESWYRRLIGEIKRYCKAYRTIIFRNTVEGAIICEESIGVFLEWLLEYWNEDTYNAYITEINAFNIVAQVSITRGIFHGKTDYLMKFSENAPPEINAIINNYEKGGKTDGWIFKFFDWYFAKYMVDTEEKNIKLFSITFPEIYEVVQYVNYMIK